MPKFNVFPRVDRSTLQLKLPWPPTVNTYWRFTASGPKISKAGRAYREAVVAHVLDTCGVRKEPRTGRLAVCMRAHPPDRRRRDLDNLPKAVLDALEAAGVYEDDSQIDALMIVRRPPLATGAIITAIMPIDALPAFLETEILINGQ